MRNIFFALFNDISINNINNNNDNNNNNNNNNNNIIIIIIIIIIFLLLLLLIKTFLKFIIQILMHTQNSANIVV